MSNKEIAQASTEAAATQGQWAQEAGAVQALGDFLLGYFDRLVQAKNHEGVRVWIASLHGDDLALLAMALGRRELGRLGCGEAV